MELAVLLSIQPQWCEKIASGEKTVEVRKNAPKLKTPFKVYMYETLGKRTSCRRCSIWQKCTLRSPFGCHEGAGAVIGEFVCSKIYEIEYGGCRYMINNDRSFTNRIAEESCLWYDDLYRYLGDKTGYGWIITNVKIYEQPKMLGEFITPSGTGGVSGNHYLYRPPQSWCYVEELI